MFAIDHRQTRAQNLLATGEPFIDVEGRVRDPVPTTYLWRLCARLGLPQNPDSVPRCTGCPSSVRLLLVTDSTSKLPGAREADQKLLYRTTGLWLGRPTGRVNNSVMFRCRLSFAGRRIAYFTSRPSNAAYSSGLAKAASARKTTSLPCACWRLISGSSHSSQPSALWTLPGRSLAARQSPSRLNSSSGC